MGEDGDKEEKAVRSTFSKKKPECPILWEFDGAVKFSKFALRHVGAFLRRGEEGRGR